MVRGKGRIATGGGLVVRERRKGLINQLIVEVEFFGLLGGLKEGGGAKRRKGVVVFVGRGVGEEFMDFILLCFSNHLIKGFTKGRIALEMLKFNDG